MPHPLYIAMAVAGLLLAGCGDTPESARKKLEGKSVPLSEQALLSSTKEKSAEKTANLLVMAGVDPNARQANGMTVLMSAVFNGQYDTARQLLEKGARVNDAAKGFTALRLAVERDDLKMAKLLLEHGADPTLHADGAPSALEKANQGNNREMAEMLGRKAGK